MRPALSPCQNSSNTALTANGPRALASRPALAKGCRFGPGAGPASDLLDLLWNAVPGDSRLREHWRWWPLPGGTLHGVLQARACADLAVQQPHASRAARLPLGSEAGGRRWLQVGGSAVQRLRCLHVGVAAELLEHEAEYRARAPTAQRPCRPLRSRLL